MGAAVGQDCALLEEVCGWINAKSTVPVWAKMTPNITDITQVGLLFCSHSYLLRCTCEEGSTYLMHGHVVCTSHLLNDMRICGQYLWPS